MTKRPKVSPRRSTWLHSSGSDGLVQDILYRIREVNKRSPESSITDFEVDGVSIGKVTPSMLDKLVRTPVFEMKDESTLTLSTTVAGTTCESRTEAVQSVMQELKAEGIVTGWRDELYPITKGFHEDPIFLMERAAVPVIGGLEYGVHMNGLVLQDDGREMMWVGRRSKTKSKYPGMLDHMAAGGQPAGLSLMNNVIKECEEEAGVPVELTRAGIKATGAISYHTYEHAKDQISRAVLFCFDLWLPQDFQPKPVDGEVDEFFLWDIDQIKESFSPDFPDPIKPNCYVVVADYLLRAGHINPDTPGYLDVLKELRSGDCR